MLLHWRNQLKLYLLLLVNFIQTQNGMVSANIFNDSEHINASNLKLRVSDERTNTRCVQFGAHNKLCLHSNRHIPSFKYLTKYGIWPNLQELLDKGRNGGFVDLTRLGDDLRQLHSVTRSDSFSEDYLDIGDLWSSITSRKMVDDDLEQSPAENGKVVIKVIGNNFRSEVNPSNGPVFTVLRTLAQSDDGSESSEEKPKRFEVIENSSDSDESDSESDEKVTPVEVKNVKYIYSQGPTRHLSLYRRRRLPYFLPKRYHWSEGDLSNLPSLWFSGPQGQYAGVYRKPF